MLEVGAGDGRSFAHYPSAVVEIVAVEPEPYLRRQAVRAAASARGRVSVLDGVAESLPVADHRFDAAVVSLVLCSVADQAAALAELRRVLLPGGELRFLEHVAAAPGVVSAAQRALDRTGIWPALGGGCHLARDTVSALGAAGFQVERVQRVDIGVVSRAVPFLLGRATCGPSHETSRPPPPGGRGAPSAPEHEAQRATRGGVATPRPGPR